MEKKIYELEVDTEFAQLIPPPAADERQRLEESIKKEGCTEPLTVWHGTIIDGHNRYSICCRLGIPFTCVEKDDLPDRNAVKAWIIEHQLARRNLTPYQKSKLALAFEPILKEQAKERQGTRTDLNPDMVKMPSRSPEEGKTRSRLAKLAGVSHDTITKVKKIDTVADDEMKQKLADGDISVNKAYRTLFNGTVIAKGKKAIHVEGKMPDVPESFPTIQMLLEDVKRNYLVSLEHTLKQYTSGMATEDNKKFVKTLFQDAGKEGNKIVKAWIDAFPDQDDQQ